MCGIIGVFKSNPSTCDDEIVEGFDLLNKRGPDSSKYINTKKCLSVNISTHHRKRENNIIYFYRDIHRLLIHWR